MDPCYWQRFITLFLELTLLINCISSHCGSRRLNASHGIIQTPNFPHKFTVPINCQWIIDASHLEDPTITLYLTQLYVLKGLTVTEYLFYESKNEKYGDRKIFTVTEANVTKTSFLQQQTKFLVIDFEMDELEGNQLRALDGLLDVFGFNITYQISKEPHNVSSCSVRQCSFTGNCYAERNLSYFWCSCFENFSGPKCDDGPLCETQGSLFCQNGGICRQRGANAFVCQCPSRFTGSYCSFPVLNQTKEEYKECGEFGCSTSCEFDGRPEHVCNCPKGSKVPHDRVRYECTLQLANINSVFNSRLSAQIERQISKYLKNISKIENLRVVDISNGGNVTFHFFGMKKDGSRIRDGLNKLIANERLGNLTFASAYVSVKEKPTLFLEAVAVNQHPRGIKDGDEFILSCKAQGTSDMTFQWYKDGVFVNTTRAVRSMWTHLQHSDTNSHNQYTARLGIANATVLDEGVYTCQVEDGGMQQCKSIRIVIIGPPIVEVEPRSITLQKGDNATIMCVSRNDRKQDGFGYIWMKNEGFFKPKAESDYWEELYPYGSILRLTNVQKSVRYACKVQSNMRIITVEVRIEVVNKSIIPLCLEERYQGVIWNDTAPGADCIRVCPHSFTGVVRRMCILKHQHHAVWDVPDFSGCTSPQLLSIQNNFLRLTTGFQNTTIEQTLNDYFHEIKNRHEIYPGEGERILKLLLEVVNYMNETKSYSDIDHVTKLFFKILDLLLKHKYSFLRAEQIGNLQRLIRNQALLTGSFLKPISDVHEKLDTFIANLHTSSIYNLHVPLTFNSFPSWFIDKLDIHIDNINNYTNETFTIAIIAFHNLTDFLPTRSVAQMSNGNDLEYEIISKIISVSLGGEYGKLLNVRPGTIWLNLEINHAENNDSSGLWNITCAVSDVAANDRNQWDLESCTTITLNTTITKCSCSKMGTFAILLTTKPSPMALKSVKSEYEFIVVIGCICCLIEALVTMGVLLLYWWYHRSCLVYLKLQCCFATFGAMAVFIYALTHHLQNESFGSVTTLLETFLLVGMSSHLSKLLIVYSELVQIARQRVRHLKATMVAIITGVPIIIIFGDHLAHRSIQTQLDSWWLHWGTLAFHYFIISTIILFLLFVFLYFYVMKKLHLLVTKHLTNNKALQKRIGLLRRSALIYISSLLMVMASILYINLQDAFCHYLFSISSALLGFLELICYVVKCENSMRAHLIKKLKLHGADDDFSSDSVNSPLSFFTKQEPEAESESAAPPRQTQRTKSIESTEGLLHSNIMQRKLKYPSCLERNVGDGSGTNITAPSTVDTYLHSISEDSIDMETVLQRSDIINHDDLDDDDVNLEFYQSSPKKYRKSPIDAALYSESEWFGAGGRKQMAAPPPDILTTRVRVELMGLVPATQHSAEANIFVEAPSIRLCNIELDTSEQKTITAEPETSTNNGTSIKFTTSLLNAKSQSQEQQSIENENEELNERKQPEGREKTPIPIETIEDNNQNKNLEDNEDDNLDGMLDRISHDLDYLLNRRSDVTALLPENLSPPSLQITPPPPPLPTIHICRKTSKLPSSNIQTQIVEELEEEEEEETNDNVNKQSNTSKTNDSDLGILKTAC